MNVNSTGASQATASEGGLSYKGKAYIAFFLESRLPMKIFFYFRKKYKLWFQ